MNSRAKSPGTDQQRKFAEAARELGCDEDAFDKALKKVASASKATEKRKTPSKHKQK
jgi:hypothetical protein